MDYLLEAVSYASLEILVAYQPGFCRRPSAQFKQNNSTEIKPLHFNFSDRWQVDG